MNCSECNVDIPPAWKHSYESNHCPSCGGKIFDGRSVDLMKELKEAMEKMPNDPQGLAGWLLSNYRMEKVGDGEPTGFHGNKPQAVAKAADGQPLKLAPNRLQQFLKNAGVKPAEPARMTNLAKQINNAGLDDGVDYGIVEEGEATEEVEDFVEEANDPDFTQKVLTGMTPGAPGRFTATERKALMQKMAENSSNDMGDLHPALQDDRRERLRKQQELTHGGAVGKITRR
jgi:DNA-directed RNA polymerase subunit RPC12/RpoP